MALAASVGLGQATAAQITKAEAKRIALTAAGKKPEDYIASGRTCLAGCLGDDSLGA